MNPRDVFTFFDEESKVWRGLDLPPLYNLHQGLGEFLHQVLGRAPEKVAQISVDSGITVTYGLMRMRSVRFAQNLSGLLALDENDVVAIAARNGEKLAPVVFGCLMAGLTVNPLDPALRADDFAHMLQTIRPRIVLCDSDLVDEMHEALRLTSLTPELIVFGKRINGYTTVDDLLVPTGMEHTFQPCRIHDPETRIAVIVCSSGTTGRQKGVCLAHTLCISGMTALANLYEHDRVLCFSSLYWVSGFGILLTGTAAGTTRIITRDRFRPDLMIDIAEQYRTTVVFLAPSQALDVLAHPTIGMADFSSLRSLLCGGGPVSKALKESFDRYLPHGQLYVGYGLSETAACGFSTSTCYKDNAIGILSPRMSAKIADEDGTPLDSNQNGELLIKGNPGFLGYFDNSEASIEALDPDGWLRTGDIAKYDDDGVFYIVDRKKDIMKYAGYQISPSEIEHIIMNLTDVLSVCVTGIPIPGHDLPAALVVKRPEADLLEQDVINWVAECMTDFKQLRGGVYFVDSIPMTSTGKLLRRECRTLAIGLYHENRANTDATP